MTTTSKTAVKAAPKKEAKTDKYIEAVGRRKTAVARVRLYTVKLKDNEKVVTVNEKPLTKYFSLVKQARIVVSPFDQLSLKEYRVSAKATGGGPNAQAEAIRHGISRVLIAMNPIWRTKLKQLGFLKRDPRAVERKHPGMRKARRPQQWRKR
jgi:small subunit ribosomal protein S9